MILKFLQKLIFIGKPEILDDINIGLEKSLFTAEELEKGDDYIQQLPDPFGNWQELFQAADGFDDAE